MSYQVLARKYRPANFAELEGQEHVLQALINALEQNRLHQAYLFTGTRGVGKTTIARILAKCLNCETGITATPCGECESCREIAEGRSVDLIEVDAASRTGVDDMRDLLDNVQYMPTGSRFKIYLIDEVHMLSRSSFNAMLKTLEEPPEHVKFLFATTDPKKLPITVLSRCLQFNLKNLSPEQIVGYLGTVLEAEGITFEEAALWQLGRAADGSMRDALSLTDQAIAFGDGVVTDASVRSMLGSIDQQEVFVLLDGLIARDASRILNHINALAEFAPDYATLLGDLLSVLHRVSVAQLVPDAIDNSHGDRELVVTAARLLSKEDVQLLYQMGLNGQRDLPFAPDPRGGFEMTLMRMLAFTPLTTTDDSGGGTSGGENLEQVQPRSDSPLADILTSLRTEKSEGTPGKVTENAVSISRSARSDESRNSNELTEQKNKTPVAVPHRVVSGADSALGKEDRKPVPVQESRESRESKPDPIQGTTDSKESNQGRVGGESREKSRENDSEPVAQLSSVPDPVSVAVRSKPSEPVGETVDIKDLSWSEILSRLALSGVTRTLAANCTVGSRDESSLQLLLSESHASLWNQVHEERISQALSVLTGKSVGLSISIGLAVEESPAQLQQRQQEQDQARAVELMNNDEVIQTLVSSFNGRLDQDSITPIQPGDSQ